MSAIRWVSPASTPAKGLHPLDSNVLARRPRPVPPRDRSFPLLDTREGRLGEDKRGRLCIKYLERRRPLENSSSVSSALSHLLKLKIVTRQSPLPLTHLQR